MFYFIVRNIRKVEMHDFTKIRQNYKKYFTFYGNKGRK